MRKLQVAGKGDAKRLMDRLDDIARRLDDPAADVHELANALADWKTIELNWRKDFLGPGSLLTKTLLTSLSPDQAALRELALAKEGRPRYEWSIAGAMQSLRANLGLSDHQTQQLSRLLLKETRPPKKFGNASDIALVLRQASGLPEETLHPDLRRRSVANAQTLAGCVQTRPPAGPICSSGTALSLTMATITCRRAG